MNIRIAFPCIAAVACSAALAAEPQAPPRPPLHLWGTSAHVSVDAGGNITAVETPAEYSQAIRDALDAQVRKLHYEAPVIDGKAVPGETWVQIAACTAQEGDAYRLALKFRGNGPVLANQVGPVFPFQPMRAGVTAKYEVAIRIAPDGSATLERATALVAPKRYGSDFEHALKNWVKEMRYRVESVDGKPVGGQVTQKVDFVADGPAFTSGSMAQARQQAEAQNAKAAQAQAQASETCALALKAHESDPNRQVAAASPIKVSEAN